MDRSTVFDQEISLQINPDVAQAVTNGSVNSGFQHSANLGWAEKVAPQFTPAPDPFEPVPYSTPPRPPFYEETYLLRNPDVAEAVANGLFNSGLQHWATFGFAEGRRPQDINFEEDFYLSYHPDVAAAVANGSVSNGLEHYAAFGWSEGRTSVGQLFREKNYLQQNPDVAQAVANGSVKSGFQHWVNFGFAEGRTPQITFDENSYLATYPDVAAAVANGRFVNGLAHFAIFGVAEGRVGQSSQPGVSLAVAGLPDRIDNNDGNDGIDHGPDPLTGGIIPFTAEVIGSDGFARPDHRNVYSILSGTLQGGTGEITGFPNLRTALANNGYSIDELTGEWNSNLTGSSYQGDNLETRRYNGDLDLKLRGEDLVGGSSLSIIMDLEYLKMFTLDKVTGVTDFWIPQDRSAGSSSGVQEVAQALLTDIGDQGIRFNFGAFEPDLNRYGVYTISSGQIELGV